MDDLYLGYLLDALDPAEAAAVEAHLRTHPDEAAKLDQLRRVLRPGRRRPSGVATWPARRAVAGTPARAGRPIPSCRWLPLR